jgi:hypothetical protein
MTPRLVLLSALLGACSAGAPPTGEPPTDASVDAAPTDVALPMDLPSEGDGAGPCSFNRDCISAERCECDEVAGCRCAPGPRGVGVAGVTACTSGNDCASALCVQSSAEGSLCSDACTGSDGCPAALPRCLSISGVGSFCARDPSARDAGAATTSLTAVFGGRRASFERAQHGNASPGTLLVEAHSGGDPACPTMTSPTPRRTLSIRGVRATADPAPQTEADGVAAVLFDFGGDLTSAPLLRATAVRVTPRAYLQDGSVSLSVSVTFAEGTVTGDLVAPHCASLD